MLNINTDNGKKHLLPDRLSGDNKQWPILKMEENTKPIINTKQNEPSMRKTFTHKQTIKIMRVLPNIGTSYLLPKKTNNFNPMKAMKQLERLKQLDALIKAEKTGSPKDFAAMLRISKSQLFNLLEELKIMGAPIKYSRIKNTYFYEGAFEMKLNYSLTFIKGNHQ